MAPAQRTRNHWPVVLFLTHFLLSTWLAFPSSAQAGFQITTRLYPLPPGYAAHGYWFPLVSNRNGIFLVYHAYAYARPDSTLRAQVFATRVTPQGQVLDTLPIPIALWTIGWDRDAGNVSWKGSPSDSAGFFMVWDLSDTTGGYRLKLMGNRLGLNGILIDSIAIPLLSPKSGQTNYTCVRGDSLYLLLWEDKRAGRFSTRASRIRGDRTALDPEGFHLNLTDTLYSKTGYGENNAAYNGRVFLAVWDTEPSTDYYHLWAARVREDGVVLDTVPLKLTRGPTSHSGTGCNPLAGSDGRDFFVAFRLRDSLSTRNYFSGVRVTGSGVLLDSVPIRISSVSNYPTGWGMAFNGRDYQLVWGDGDWIVGARVSPQGVVKDTLQVPLFPRDPNFQGTPDLALGPDGKLLVAWVSSYPFPHIWGGFLDTTGREVGVEVLRAEVPGERLSFQVGQNLPNPWSKRTSIAYTLPHEAQVALLVYNPVGQLVRSLVNGEESAGYKQVAWDGRDDFGRKVPSGVYFYRLQAGEFSDTKKMVLIR
jgi:hypothetical protein